jgi:hypothetical protein
LVVQPNYSGLKVVWGEFGARSVFVLIRNAMRFLSVLSLEALFTTGLMAQTTAARAPAGIHLNSAPQYRVSPANPVVNGLPGGRTQVSRPMNSTPANDAVLRNNAWAAYNAELHQIPTTTNPNRLAARQNLLDQDRFIQRPTSSHRYNFQFSDNEIRSVQAALRRNGTYSGQVDGILGPDTRRAIEEYQGRNKLPVTGQPDRGLNASLGIF